MSNTNQDALDKQLEQLEADETATKSALSGIATTLNQQAGTIASQKESIASLQKQLDDAVANNTPLDFTRFQADLKTLEDTNAEALALNSDASGQTGSQPDPAPVEVPAPQQ